MASTSLAVTWLWLLLAGGVGTLPIGGAPLPLDPTLSAIAPEECLWYVSFSGHGPADPQSENQTEQLFAEPQVQRFCQEVEAQLLKAVRRAGGPSREQRILATELPKLVKVLLTRPIAAYVEEVVPTERGVDAQAAIVLNTGDQRAEFESAIKELLKLMPEEAPKLETESVADVEWTRVPTPPSAPAVRFGWKDDYFIIAIGEETPTNLAERMGADVASSHGAPEWLTAIRNEHPVQREMSLGYLNVAGILERVQPIIEAQEPKAWPIVEKLGLTSIVALHGVNGYDETSCISMGHIVTKDGERPGLLAFLPHEPLAEEDLQLVPKDALLAFAYKLDPGEAWDAALDLVGDIEPRAREEFDRELWKLESEGLGINIRDDIVASLDDAWVAYLPGGDLMTSWLNTAAGVGVKDAPQLREAIDKVVDVAKAEFSRGPRGPQIVESTVGDQTVYSLQFTGAPVPVSPSWCISDKWLVVGLLPQAVRSALERKAEDSLAAAPGIADALSEGDGAAALAYQDTPQLVRSAYPWLQIGLQMASAQLRSEGIEIDASALPSVETIVKHLRPGVATITHSSDGFHFTSRHSLPGGGNVAAAAPIGAALLLPAIGSARVAAREAQDMNSLRNIMLAMLNHEGATKALPSNVYSDDGKPLLSWRVKVLPYLEQQALYTQFHLDEPWDSEHNKQLLQQMPQLYRSPGDPPGTTKTRFLAVSGPDTLFPGNKKMMLKQISDGTSNTLAVVQVAPENAVEWTKPADWEFDAAKPLAGLDSHRGSFIAAMCDGSCRRIELSIDPEVVKALVTRAGDEAIPQQ